MHPGRQPNDFAIAIICALPVETAAVEAVFDQIYDGLDKFYSKLLEYVNSYKTGRIGEHNVVLCCMPGTRNESAAAMANLQAIYTGIQLALAVGIGGRAPHRFGDTQIFRGDVVISDAVVGYDIGRQYPTGFQRKPRVEEIRTLLASLKARRTCIEFQEQMSQHLHVIQQSGARWRHPGSDDVLFDRRDGTEALKPSVHIGKMAFSRGMVASGEIRDEVISNEGVIGFNVEWPGGVWDNVPCIIIKGVSDYADGHDSRTWQAYAAASGASAAKTFLKYWKPMRREEREHYWMVPFRRNPGFVGRQFEINQMEAIISLPNGPKRIAICGLGGLGKTQIALELAYRMHNGDSRCSIFWIPCTSLESVEQAYMSIARVLGIQDVKPTEARAQVKNRLSQTNVGKWLLIFDDADDSEMWISDSNTGLGHFLPQNDQGHILFTTRNRRLAARLAGSNVIPVSQLDEATGLKLLEQSLIKKDLLNDGDAAIALLTQLEYFPLAISHAAAFINEKGIELSEYVTLLQTSNNEFRYKNISDTVITTLFTSFQQIQHLNQLAADYLSFLACVDSSDIPLSLLPQPTFEKKRTDAIGLLKAHSLVEQAGNSSITVHPLVRLATQTDEEQSLLFPMDTADRLEEVFQDSYPHNQQIWRQFLPHALSLIRESEFQALKDKRINLLQKVGNCLNSDGRYNETEELFSDILALQLKELGHDHPSTLTSMNNLALTSESTTVEGSRRAGITDVKDTATDTRARAPLHSNQHG